MLNRKKPEMLAVAREVETLEKTRRDGRESLVFKFILSCWFCFFATILLLFYYSYDFIIILNL